MISFLKGKIINKRSNFVILEVGGVGYKVFVNEKLISELDGEVGIYIHQHVREDALDLYGFDSLEELEFFELLLSISGIGPKSALGVFVIAEIDLVKNSIANGDHSLLVKVSGIGKKTAERVVLELRDKVGALEITDNNGVSRVGGSASDEIDGLMALGYSMQQAREALQGVDLDIKDSGERIRQALKNLGK